MLDASQKALEINLTDHIYGTFAEIGAGQEVVRHFFRAGGAAGTIAKTISAYDMTMSDTIYGKGGRYVSCERLEKMMLREYQQLGERLKNVRADHTCFFAYANTVSAKSYRGGNECHGWMGVRFQHEANAQASEIVIHVEMLDRENVQQQEAIGDLGVNLIYACFFNRQQHMSFVRSLMDGLSTDRLQIDMIKVKGPAFSHMDNRLLCLDLVKNSYCHTIMFNSEGEVVQIKDKLYKKNLVVTRGSFRPPTLLNLDMIKSAEEALIKKLPKEQQDNVLSLAEISVNQLLERGEVDGEDFLARVDLLAALNQPVLISHYKNFYALNSFLAEANRQHAIAFVTGVYNLLEIFDANKQNHNPGGVLQGLGKLFGQSTQLFIYPAADDKDPKKLLTSQDVGLDARFDYLVRYLRENKLLEDLSNYNKDVFSIWSRKVLEMIEKGDSAWEQMVPEVVAKLVKEKKLFGYKKS